MFSLNQIKKFFPFPITIVGDHDASFVSIDSLFEAKPNSLSWVSTGLPEAVKIVRECKASIIICDMEFDSGAVAMANKTFVHTQNPALAFLRVVKGLYSPPRKSGGFIHPTAIIHEKARIGANVQIGAYCEIEACEIGDGTVIESHARIQSGVILRNNVLISSYCNIGGQGFGHIRNEEAYLENMLHIGTVLIEDHVEIFPYSNVDRATLSQTKIGKHTKIDHYCHIGHNTSIGENTIITAKVVLCGGSKVGNQSWIGVGSIIRDRIVVGNQVTLGMGSIVTKNIPDSEVWTGAPAKPLDEFKKIQAWIKRSIEE